MILKRETLISQLSKLTLSYERTVEFSDVPDMTLISLHGNDMISPCRITIAVRENMETSSIKCPHFFVAGAVFSCMPHPLRMDYYPDRTSQPEFQEDQTSGFLENADN